jgi:hypothetical protein
MFDLKVIFTINPIEVQAFSGLSIDPNIED